MRRTRITRMNTNKNQEVFFELVKACLLGKEVQLSQYGDFDFNEIYRLAQEQSVVGLVAAGAAEQCNEPVRGSSCGGYAEGRYLYGACEGAGDGTVL